MFETENQGNYTDREVDEGEIKAISDRQSTEKLRNGLDM